ncbi:MAG: hypothetical protein GY814_20530, partial [Gammaproteobacteria bacterium]|nr:hypothetical protein [Gammaproteobacteria bacterium]
MNYLIKFLVVFIAQAALLFPTSVFSATTDQQSEVTKKLSELIPSSSNFSFLDGFVVSTVSNADNQIIIKGSVNAKQITITQDPTELSNFALTGEDIQLKDIIPQTSSVTFLNEFAFDRVALTGESIEVDGKINSKVVTVRTSLNLTNLEVTGEDLQLKDVIPQTASVTFLNEFAFDKFSLTDKSVEVDGKISNKAVTVTKVLDSKDFEVVGEDLQLKDIIPQTASAGFLDKFAFDKFSLTDKNVEVDGKISNKVVTVKKALDSKDFEVTGDDLQLKDIVPQTASVKFLNEFAFGKFSLTDKNIEVDGKINSKVVTVNKVLNSNDLNVTGAGLQLNDIIPQASSAKFLDAFAFDKFSLVDKDMEVDGTINKKAVTVKKVLGSKELEITGEDLQLKDIIPQTSSVTFLNEFAFDKFSLTDKDVEVDGKINLKVVTV